MTEKLMLPCDCAGTCGIALFVEHEPCGDDPQQFFMDFYTAQWAGRTFWRRLKIVWGVLRNREPVLHGLCWTGPEQPARLREWLERVT